MFCRFCKWIGLLLLAGFLISFLTPARAQTEDSATYDDPDGRFSVPIPTNWTLEENEGYLTLLSPEETIRLYITVIAGENITQAIEQAWQLVDPNFDFEPQQNIESPSAPGVEKTVAIAYQTDDENDVAQALGQLVNGQVYILLARADLIALQQRASQAQIVLTGFKIKAIEDVDLTNVEPLPVTEAMLAELEAYITDAMTRYDIPGAAVAVVQDGEIVYAKGFGVRELGKDDPVTPETLMMIGSTTKTFTTMLMAQLVDEGKLTWETPVVDILPSFALADPDRTQQIQAQHLVCACTGVPRRDLEMFFNTLTAEGVIESLADYELFTDFGEAFQYSNQMVAAAGYIAALADGADYGDLYAAYANDLQTRILDPIGMTQTTLSFESAVASGNYAMPHDWDFDRQTFVLPLSAESFVTPVAPAGALWSNVMDMGRYLITELNKGVAPDGTRVVSEENLGYTWQPQVPVTAEMSYGLGWMVGEYKGLLMLEHGGNTIGFTSDLAFLPTADLGISVITNRRYTNYFNEAVRTRLFELVFQQPTEADQTANFAYQQVVDQLRRFNDQILKFVSEEAVTPYLGTYHNAALGEMTMTLEDGKFYMDTGEFKTEILPYFDQDRSLTYFTVDPPLNGLPLELEEDDDGNPIIVLGSGVVEYTFELVE